MFQVIRHNGFLKSILNYFEKYFHNTILYFNIRLVKVIYFVFLNTFVHH